MILLDRNADAIHTFHISSSEYCPRGSILLLTVPWNRTGSWGMMPKRDLRSWSPNLQMSTPSIMMVPAEGSTSLKKTCIRVDFPLPVRPTMPIFSPPLILREIPFRTSGVLDLYRTCTKDTYVILWSGKETRKMILVSHLQVVDVNVTTIGPI